MPWLSRSGASGFWGNITINGSIGSPESRIAYAEFEFNADSTGTPCIDVSAGTAFLDHLTFGNTGAPYIHVDGASFVISHSYFPSATTPFELCHGTGGIKSGGHGIFSRNFFGKTIGYNDVVDFTGGPFFLAIVDEERADFEGGGLVGLGVGGCVGLGVGHSAEWAEGDGVDLWDCGEERMWRKKSA